MAEMNESYILLCKKDIEKDERKFPVFYGYSQELNEEGTDFIDVMVPYTDSEGKPQMKPRNFKVVLDEKLKLLLLSEDKFPYRLTLENGIDFFITVDKDKEGNARLDKYGKKHGLVVINSFKDYVPVPRKSMSFEDMDNL